MKLRTLASGVAIAHMGMASPSWAVSLQVDAGSVPERQAQTESFNAIDTVAAGTASLVPLMAAEVQPSNSSAAEQSAATGAQVGKPLDDLSFVRAATDSSRKEVSSAREALPALRNPELKRIAEMLVDDHTNAAVRLSKIAESKGWSLPAPPAVAPAPASAPPADFDERWSAEMIAGHERSIALYRAQAQGGEDPDLRKFARETLPTLEQHLAALKNLKI